MRHLHLLIVAGAVTLLSCSVNRGSPAGEEYATRSNEGDISFHLTPQAPVNGRMTVNLRADTHSGDLGEVDLRRAVALHADGKTYRPLSASTLSGHHASGAVVFEIERLPSKFSITITGVRKMGELKFDWP